MRQFAAGKGATFQLMEKIDVNGVKTSPVWQYLKKEKPGDVKWNFDAKFLIDKQGNVRKLKVGFEEGERDTLTREIRDLLK